MLIGADYYWELTTGTMSRGDAGPIAMHMRLGWVPTPAAESDERSFSLVTIHTPTRRQRTLRHQEPQRYTAVLLGLGIPWN